MANLRRRKRLKAPKTNDPIEFSDRLRVEGEELVAERMDDLGHRPVPPPESSVPYDRRRVDSLLAEKGIERPRT